MKLVRAAELTDSAPYAYAAVSSPGARLVFTAGACPPTPPERRSHPETWRLRPNR